jgi:tRNA(Glu) U13 pseudouridine synthase TruD
MNEDTSRQLVLPEWPHAFGVPENNGLIRSCPEDFVVEEIPRIQPDGEGGHLWLWVEKRAANTDWVARELAREEGSCLSAARCGLCRSERPSRGYQAMVLSTDR